MDNFNINIYKLFNPDLGKYNNTQLLMYYNKYGKNENRITSFEDFRKYYPNFVSNNIDDMKDWHLSKRFNNKDLFTDLHKESSTNLHKDLCTESSTNLCTESSMNLHKDLCKESSMNLCTESSTYLCTESFTNLCTGFSIDKYEELFLNISYIPNITFVIISDNENEINVFLNSIKLLNNNNWKILLILNGISFINNIIHDKNRIQIIKINKILNKKFLIKNYSMKFINTEWFVFMENIIFNKEIYNIFLNELKYRSDINAFVLNENIIFLNKKIFFNDNDLYLQYLQKIGLKILYYNTRIITNDIIYNLKNIDNIKTNVLTNSKNIIIKNDNDSLTDILYLYFIGSYLSKKYGFNLLIDKKSKYTLFNDLLQYSSYNDNDNEYIDEIQYSNNLNLSNDKNYILSCSDKTFYKTIFDQFKESLNYEKKKDIFISTISKLDHRKEILCIYISDKNYDKFFLKSLEYIKYNEMNIIIISKINDILFLKNIGKYILYSDKDEENEFLLMTMCNYIISNNSTFSFWASYLSSAKKIFFPIDGETHKNIDFLNNTYNVFYIDNDTSLSTDIYTDIYTDIDISTNISTNISTDISCNYIILFLLSPKNNKYFEINLISVLHKLRCNYEIYIYLDNYEISDEIKNIICNYNIHVYDYSYKAIYDNKSKIYIIDNNYLLKYNFINISYYKNDILISSPTLDNYLLNFFRHIYNYKYYSDMYFYKNNRINYSFLANKLEYNIKNYNSKKKQKILFSNSELDNSELENSELDINIIEFGDEYIPTKYDKYNVNYFFLNKKLFSEINISENINTYPDYIALAYNLVIMELSKYNLDLNELLFDKEVITTKKMFDNVGGFDPELFSNFNDNITYYSKKCISSDLYLLNFVKNRFIIDYDIFNKIKVYLINIDSRTDRLENSHNELNRLNIYNYERFSAIVPNDIDIKNCKFINPNKLLKKNKEYLKGAVGCKMSHLEVLKKSLLCEEDLIMILEDDIAFEQDTIENLNLALLYLKDKNWDILYLSSNLKKKDDAIKVNPNVLKIKKGLTTTAQIFQKSKIEKIIDYIKISDKEIDNTYDDYLKEKYCVYPMCAYQKKSFSDILCNETDYGEYHKKFIY